MLGVAMPSRYVVALRSALPRDIVARVSAVHASAVLLRQVGLRLSEDVRDAPADGQTEPLEEVGRADAEMS